MIISNNTILSPFIKLLISGLEHKPKHKDRFCIFRIANLEEPELLFEERPNFHSRFSIKRKRYSLQQLQIICTDQQEGITRLGFLDEEDTPQIVYEELHFNSKKSVGIFNDRFMYWLEREHGIHPQILDYF